MKNELPIPDSVFIPAMQRVCDESYEAEKAGGPKYRGPDAWMEADRSLCRQYCGPKYALIETDWIGNRAITIRKRSKNVKKLGFVAPKGRSLGRKGLKAPAGYQLYLQSRHWIAFRDDVAWPYWQRVFGKKCCAICPASTKLQMHHRTYQRLGREEVTDVIPLCDKHHKAVHERKSDGHFSNK